MPIPPHSIEIIGRVSSPFTGKFGIPRQPGLLAVESRIRMLPPFDQPMMFEGLEGFSHVWVSFLFHEVMEQGWRGRVRPPRLGGNERMGVFATRSPFRPNHLGLSAVRLLKIDTSAGVCLTIQGADLLDGTPIVDIKPYVPFADAFPDASSGFVQDVPGEVLQVSFTEQARSQLTAHAEPERFAELIRKVLALDPRPAYQAQDEGGREYGLSLERHNIRWQVCGGQVQVLGIEKERPE